MTTVRPNLPSSHPSQTPALLQTPKRPRESTYELLAVPRAKRPPVGDAPRAPTPDACVSTGVASRTSRLWAPAFDSSVVALLGKQQLKCLAERGIEVPNYDIAKMTEGWGHVGAGNFFNAHIADYLHKLMQAGLDDGCAIGVIGVTPSSAKKAAKYASQDFLHTVVQTHPEGLKPRVIGSMKSFVAASEDAEGAIASLTQKRIVSLTLTSTGYYQDPKTGALNLEHPDIVADLRGDASPKTVYGLLTRALARRRDAGAKPFTVLSLDNLPQNGALTRKMLTAFIAQVDCGLATWVDAEGAFPNTMVDRITPSSTQAQQDALLEKFGIRDPLAVFTEPFTQLVIEDDFCDGRPALEDVGVQFTTDVEPFSQAKQRLLNANHSVIAYAGVLSGLSYVHEFMGHEVFKQFVRTMMQTEKAVLQTVPGMDLDVYIAQLLERFENPALGDEVLRLCRRGSEKIPKFVLASIRDRIASDVDINLSSFVVALFVQYLSAHTQWGAPFNVEDPHADRLKALAAETNIDAATFLKQSGIVSDDLLQNEHFVREVKRALVTLRVLGSEKAMQSYLERNGYAA